MLRAKYSELPFLEECLDGRPVFLLPFVAGNDTFLYIEPDADSVRVLKAISISEGAYISSGRGYESDYPLPLSDTIFRCFAFQRAINVCKSVEDDLRNALAVLHKYFVLLRHSYSDDTLRTSLLLVTEIEYAFSNHRALFDRLNELVRALWRELRFFTADGQSSALPELPDSFRRIAALSFDTLVQKYRFPEPIAAFYASYRDRFMAIREIRDGIMHHGKTEDMIFQLRDGFALALDHGIARKLEGLGIWREDDLKPNRLGSLLALFAYLAKDAFDAVEALATAIRNGIRCGKPAFKPQFKTWCRSQLGSHHGLLPAYVSDPWREADSVLTLFPRERH